MDPKFFSQFHANPNMYRQKEAEHKEAAHNEAANKEAAQKEAANKEAAQKEAANKEAAQKEAAMNYDSLGVIRTGRDPEPLNRQVLRQASNLRADLLYPVEPHLFFLLFLPSVNRKIASVYNPSEKDRL